jgi:hypothetical protein
MENILTELAQFGFIASIFFVCFIILNVVIKMYGNYKLEKNSKLNLGLTDKAVLWGSVSYILTYLL